MKYDTAGNKITEQIQNCDCGLTGGCSKCNQEYLGFKVEKKEWLKQNEWGFMPREDRFPLKRVMCPCCGNPHWE